MSLLDGVVPYGMGPGNHDQPTSCSTSTSRTRATRGCHGTAGIRGASTTTTIELFSGGGMDFVIVHLTFCPPAAAVTWADSVFKALPGPNRDHDDPRVSRPERAAIRRLVRGHAVPLGRTCRDEPESAFHAGGSRARRVAPHRHGQRPPGVPDDGRLPGPPKRGPGVAAHPPIRAGGQQGLRPDVLAVAEPVRERRGQRVHAGLPDGRRLHHRGHDDGPERQHRINPGIWSRAEHAVPVERHRDQRRR